ncbi:hypothetical protein [Sedimenticola selenatireducens]|uniref:Uncharacterized protein n=1 Tax=Sedimenticola selenatireducens TaxID=191960 RepID=A0A558E0Y7_9GAMM|nr:hypothetical protein [Sedimenticola selenatireducens]TVO75124.1 hypothetical protein FHP88_08915 [Sedimenticola selenatireducens]TVT67021.1 MAG: hypothetical protein FHK78_01440 [Sedimenticola selenatireducens]
MIWQKNSKYHSDSDQGYRVCACRVSVSAGWLYVAWGPERAEWKEIIKFMRTRYGDVDQVRQYGLLAHYSMGEPVPGPRECLGVFGSPEEAKGVCGEHWEINDDCAA